MKLMNGLQNMPEALESLFGDETYKGILLASGGIQVDIIPC